MARRIAAALTLLTILIVSACNLAGAPSQEEIAQTTTAEVTLQPSWTPVTTNGAPTTLPLTQPTSLPTFAFPTVIISAPTSVPPIIFPTNVPFFPTNTPFPLSIVILSPVPGNIVAGNVQIIGSASHPQFLQYQVEFGPDPNPGNLWFPATGAVTTPISNGILGIWNTTSVQDAKYQLRLRVYLRDGTLLTTVINNITVQNHINTPVPSPTPNIPRPIAAFSQDKAAGDVPLTINFVNQSQGTINTVLWNFGDGNASNDVSPSHTFGAPGLYTVTLTITGPGGSSNVSRQINATSPTVPVAGFTQDKTSGLSPLPVQFSDQSSGNITSYLWNFSDGSTSSQRNPSHTFTTPGTYNVFLTVTGPGGSSSVTRQITVTSLVSPTFTPSLTYTPTFTPTNTTTAVPPTATNTPVPPTATNTPTNTTTAVPPTATFTATVTNTPVPGPVAAFDVTADPGNSLSIQFVNKSTGQLVSYAWDFGDGGQSNQQNPQHVYAQAGTYNVSLTVTDGQGQISTYKAGIAVVPPLKANFTAQVSNLDVQFTDESTGTVAQYAWNFGDNGTSNLQSPQHTYAQAGTYNVTLTVVDASNHSDSIQEQVNVSAPLEANFTAQANGLTLALTDTSTGTEAARSWNFGDGSPADTTSPTQHTYAQGGTYTVTLTVTDTSGGTNVAQQQVTVTAPLQANFTTQINSLTVTFTDTSVGNVASRTWEFGDNSKPDTSSPTQHTYAQGGFYVVKLTVTDASGQSNSTQQQVTVTAPLQANFTAQPSGLTVTLTDTSTGSIASRSWDFGDGSPADTNSPTQHTYAQGGTYTITLNVTDTSGQTNSAQQQITVTAPVQANFTAQPSGLTVTLTDTSTGSVASRTWDFGDGSPADTNSPTQHTYAQGGTYTVTLTVTDAGGQTNTAQQQVTVTAPVQANFTAQPNGLTVAFTDTSTGAENSRTWDFGDGSPADGNSPTQHTYAQGGTYTVTLTVTDASGQTNSTQQQVTVAAALQANFTAQPTDLTVAFTDTSTGNVASRSWDFGDGTPADTNSPTQHTYSQAGTYTVTLTVTDAGGQTNSTQQQVTVAAALQANFTAQPTDLTVAFTDTSTGNVASRSWDFGDGTPADTNSPTQHTYAQAGTYTVSLTVTDAGGQTNTAQQQVTVTAPAAQPTQPPQQTIVDTTPILPDMNALHDSLHNIYTSGSSAGDNAHVFGFAGDSVFTQQNILNPFGAQGQYNLNNHNDLQAGIDWYSSADLGGNNSFNHGSVAVNGNWTAQDLLDPTKADPSCNGDSPLACELHQIHPVLLFVAIGTNDAKNGTDAGAFQNTLNQIVSTITTNGTIPVLMTLPDDGSIPNLEAYNEAIIAVAQQNNIPLLNVTRALKELSDGTNLNTSPNGAGALGNGAVSKFGINALNLDLLQIVTDARNIIFPDAT